MEGHKIFLTKSEEVANIIFNSKSAEKGTAPTMGSAYKCDKIPIEYWKPELIYVDVKYVNVKEEFREIIVA